MKNRDDDNLGYLREVMQSNVCDTAKLFFAEVITHDAFRAYFGLWHPDWPKHTEAIIELEMAGFLAVARKDGHIRKIAHRDWIGLPLHFPTERNSA